MEEKCKFCQIFWEIPKKHWNQSLSSNGKVFKNERKCPKKKDYVIESNGCEKLELTTYIRCTHWNQQIATQACLNRQKTGECKNCRQGKQLLKLYRKLNPPKKIMKKGESK